jgi:tRNA nucleotidyltransferase (CCA-adding enzyme)
MASAEKPSEDLTRPLLAKYPELSPLLAATTQPLYVVGGAVRDLLLGRERADLDLVVVGDAFALARRLGAEPVEHERFGTASVVVDGHQLDLASARTESYSRPGALPVVAPATAIEDDLRRRDFTINAMAIPLAGPGRLVDPHRGREDLAAGLLRVLHEGSFADDPTRAIRAARYAARFGFEPEPRTAELLRATDLGTVSGDRRRAELLRLASEEAAPRGLRLLAEWGLIEPQEAGVELAARVSELLARAAWGEIAPRPEALLRAALGPLGAAAELAAAAPERPSQAVALARGHEPTELVLARALGAAWLDDFVARLRAVALEIDGGDLIAAGVPEGPAVGRGLLAALEAKLDGAAGGREQELAVALAASRSA